MSETVGLNLTHDASLCRCIDGEVDLFIEEERLSRKKHDSMPLKAILEYIEQTSLGETNIGLTGLHYSDYDLKDTASYIEVAIRKKLRGRKDSSIIADQHHLLHALCGFYHSGFEEAEVIVVDGMGNYIDEDYHECATRWHISKPCTSRLLEQQGTTRYDSKSFKWNKTHVDWTMGIGMAYASIASYLGFGSLGSGKVMGLAPYGEEDENIKPFIIDDRVNSKLFYRSEQGSIFIPYDYLPEEPELDNQKIRNLCYRLQKDFEKWMIDFILKCESKNIVLTGGCALNCVANYNYLKYIPDDVKLYIEPVSTDAGTAIGLAKYMHYSGI
tara:strand:- start:44 stop:1027 length:984 start_codon:yes stop_codon:yes gene_type:complete